MKILLNNPQASFNACFSFFGVGGIPGVSVDICFAPSAFGKGSNTTSSIRPTSSLIAWGGTSSLLSVGDGDSAPEVAFLFFVFVFLLPLDTKFKFWDKSLGGSSRCMGYVFCCLWTTYPNFPTIPHVVHLVPWQSSSFIWRVISLMPKIVYCRRPPLCSLGSEFFHWLAHSLSLATSWEPWLSPLISLVLSSSPLREWRFSFGSFFVLGGLCEILVGFFLDGVDGCWPPSVPPLVEDPAHHRSRGKPRTGKKRDTGPIRG